MAATRINRADLFAHLPPAWPEDLLPTIQAQLRARPHKVVVLDDDPTGTQTVHDVPVLTQWSIPALAAELADDAPAVYLLTNSRSLSPAAAAEVNRTIGHNLAEAVRSAGRPAVVVSRSDSTLRGHFPGEVMALEAALGRPADGWLIIPFFLEGGRYTIGDIHYVDQDGWLVPAGATPFAQDATFGYAASDLRQWVEEKTGGAVRAAEVASISLADLRQGGPAQVQQKLMALENRTICIVNAAAMRDLEVLVTGLLTAEAQGKRFIYRTAASFVQTRIGLAPRPVLTPGELYLATDAGGLVIVGSHVPTTTAQLHILLTQADVTPLEVSPAKLLDGSHRTQEIQRVAHAANQALQGKATVVVYTGRHVITGENAADSLSLSRQISAGLVAIVRAITVQPRYLVAKGGITSSDVATQGLEVRRALVLGQILPGVPVWQLGTESRFPELPYVVFPGNVGDRNSLATLLHALT